MNFCVEDGRNKKLMKFVCMHNLDVKCDTLKRKIYMRWKTRTKKEKFIMDFFFIWEKSKEWNNIPIAGDNVCRLKINIHLMEKMRFKNIIMKKFWFCINIILTSRKYCFSVIKTFLNHFIMSHNHIDICIRKRRT